MDVKFKENLVNEFKLGVASLLIILVSGCSSIHDAEISEVVKAEQNNPLTVKDAVVATLIKAPMPLVGTKQSEIKGFITSSSASILKQSGNLIIARFKTKNSQLESMFEYCDLEYHFSLLEFTRGPYVIGACSSIVIEGTKVN